MEMNPVHVWGICMFVIFTGNDFIYDSTSMQTWSRTLLKYLWRASKWKSDRKYECFLNIMHLKRNNKLSIIKAEEVLWNIRKIPGAKWFTHLFTHSLWNGEFWVIIEDSLARNQGKTMEKPRKRWKDRSRAAGLEMCTPGRWNGWLSQQRCAAAGGHKRWWMRVPQEGGNALWLYIIPVSDRRRKLCDGAFKHTQHAFQSLSVHAQMKSILSLIQTHGPEWKRNLNSKGFFGFFCKLIFHLYSWNWGYAGLLLCLLSGWVESSELLWPLWRCWIRSESYSGTFNFQIHWDPNNAYKTQLSQSALIIL